MTSQSREKLLRKGLDGVELTQQGPARSLRIGVSSDCPSTLERATYGRQQFPHFLDGNHGEVFYVRKRAL